MARRAARIRTSTLPAAVLATAAVLGLSSRGRPVEAGQAPAAAPTARAAALSNLTGYWVSIVTEDWTYRMITPTRGDYAGVPLTPMGRQVADTWDPAKDAAGGNACRAYGAGGIMRQPARLHVTWADDNTLQMDIDAGTQTRLFRFNASRPQVAQPPTWQGTSAATWIARGRGTNAPALAAPSSVTGSAPGAAAAPTVQAASADTGRGMGTGGGGSLKVVTTRMRPGYLRLNGVAYSANATLTEWYDRMPPEANGDQWLVVTSIVDDPQYLQNPFITTAHFKLEPDGSKWNPTPCDALRAIRAKR